MALLQLCLEGTRGELTQHLQCITHCLGPAKTHAAKIAQRLTDFSFPPFFLFHLFAQTGEPQTAHHQANSMSDQKTVWDTCDLTRSLLPNTLTSANAPAFLSYCTILSRSVMSDSLQPQGMQPTRLLCPWRSSREEYWSGLPRPPQGDLANPGIEPRSPTLPVDSLPSEPRIYLQHQWSNCLRKHTLPKQTPTSSTLQSFYLP